MSYRAFKRLLGETSLERKCRWLLGSGVLVLMTVSFYIYSSQTEGLAYDQLAFTGRTLVAPIITRQHVGTSLRKESDLFGQDPEAARPGKLKDYKYKIIKPDATRPESQPSADDLAILQAFRADPRLTEDARSLPHLKEYYYYGAIRAGESCVACHRNQEAMSRYMDADEDRPAAGLANPALQPGDLMAVVRVELSTEMIEAGVHRNRALLIAFAIGTTFLILAGSYAVIRYVIVKPVKHLKAVSDAIAAGQLNVRSEIQTADEFEDLSDAFNRMLRNLTNVQERNRNLIADLDRKVDELARLNMALFESNRLKGDFLSTMSHELRTPLNSVIGFSEVLLNADNLSEKQHRWAANIMTSGQQLLAMINDILELAKAEAGKMRLHPEEMNVVAVCEQAAALYRQQAEKKNIDLRVQVAADVPKGRQDAGKLGQILNNLISNAIKFTPEGGRVTLRAATEGSQLVFTVTDTGVGIAAEEQELVFDKFRQASNPLTREQGGSGLGLSIVRELSKLLGGEVTLKSDLGRGSTFTVRVAARLKDDVSLAFDLPEEPVPPLRSLPPVPALREGTGDGIG
ncbi:ATP-binding protein [Fimbriiglobus ruber]|uniref:histidine kinase n=1 Tax=Fimbriiglobus ruber TaxID=1908690 RepID=A0A225DXA4_9BACT|nr:ATP-binding protein [Fimbriiglobus ruber]OWK43128.1 sensory transduction histidine kinase [Fimbriiglobus ruber]